ncbi:MAG: hypothetical protein VB858_18040, partial [Planctomycetaceae bacterium]
VSRLLRDSARNAGRDHLVGPGGQQGPGTRLIPIFLTPEIHCFCHPEHDEPVRLTVADDTRPSVR